MKAVSSSLDAVIVGAGPNGLAAAVELARVGLEVRVLERADAVGGGARTEELTLPGFTHDVCSAVHPLAVGSPFLSRLPLEDHGLEWIHSPAPLAHPLDDGRAVTLERGPVRISGGEVGDQGGSSPDSPACRPRARRLLGPVGSADPANEEWRRLMAPFLDRWWDLAGDALGPLSIPGHPVLMLRFALRGLRSARSLTTSRLETREGQALFAGLAAHSALPLDRVPSAAVGMVLALAGHTVGWPIPRGGAGAITKALANHLRRLGGSVETGRPVDSLDSLPRARAVLLDLTPRQILRLCGDRLPVRYRAELEAYRYGPAAFKLDWALDGPIPWTATACRQAVTVHVGGDLDEIARSEAAPREDRVAERPFVLLAQPSLFDDSRVAGEGHTAWAYCHVPHGWDGNATDRIEAQVERFAPGFRDRILARSVMGPAALERHNPNLVGGDIGGGVQDLGQLFFRPVRSLRPYRIPVPGLYLCSSSTPPGGGVHGMCGFHAARTVLADLFPREARGGGRKSPPPRHTDG